MTPDELFEDMEKSKEEFHRKRNNVAKIAYTEMKTLVDKWQKHDIDFFWDGTIEIDGEHFYKGDLDGEES